MSRLLPILLVALWAASGNAQEEEARKPLFDGRTLKGWQVIEESDFKRHGVVEVVDGAIVLGAGKPATGVKLAAPLPCRVDYEIRLEAKRLEGDDFFCGLTFPYRDTYCTLILGGWGGMVTGLSNVDNEAAVENRTANFVPFESNRWYRVRLRVAADRIQAWVDDQRIVDLPTEGRTFSIWWEQEPVRPLGIASWYTKAALRKLTFERLAP